MTQSLPDVSFKPKKFAIDAAFAAFVLTSRLLGHIPATFRFVRAALYTGWLRPRAFKDCRETTYTDSEAVGQGASDEPPRLVFPRIPLPAPPLLPPPHFPLLQDS